MPPPGLAGHLGAPRELGLFGDTGGLVGGEDGRTVLGWFGGLDFFQRFVGVDVEGGGSPRGAGVS